MPTVSSLNNPNSFFRLDPIKGVSLLVAKIKQLATAIFSRLAAFFTGRPGRSAGLRRDSEGRQDVISSTSSSPERLEGKGDSQPSAQNGFNKTESHYVNADVEVAGVKMPEGIAKGSKKSVSEIIKSLSACFPAEEEPFRIRIWDVNKDAEAIAPKLEEMHVLEEYSREQFKELMFAEIKSANTHDLNTLMRCMLALNENWPFFDEMEALQECVVWRREPPSYKTSQNQVEGNLLIRAIQKNALSEGWIETTFANFKEWNRLSDWVDFFVRLDESKIKKYAKEFHFPLSLDYFGKFFADGTPLVLFVFKGENEDKLPLFLSLCEREIHSAVLSSLFHPDYFSERIKKECFDIVFPLNLSKDARGILMEYLLSNDFRDKTKERNEYLEDLLKQGQEISFPWKTTCLYLPKGYIFLPVEGNEETKKATVDLLIKIIRSPHIQHPMPIFWLATVMAYLLNLDLSDVGEEISAPFGKEWNKCVISQEVLDLKEEDYSLLEELVSILSTTKPILKGSLSNAWLLEHDVCILASIFLGLDKLRLSGIEYFEQKKDKQNWSHKIEALMKKITEAIANTSDFREDIFYYTVFPYALIAFFFTNKLNEEHASAAFQAIERVDHRLHPLIKPFFAAWGSLDKGERGPSSHFIRERISN